MFFDFTFCFLGLIIPLNWTFLKLLSEVSARDLRQERIEAFTLSEVSSRDSSRESSSSSSSATNFLYNILVKLPRTLKKLKFSIILRRTFGQWVRAVKNTLEWSLIRLARQLDTEFINYWLIWKDEIRGDNSIDWASEV